MQTTISKHLSIEDYLKQEEKFTKTDPKTWLFQEFYEEDETITIQLENISLQFDDIYHKVDF